MKTTQTQLQCPSTPSRADREGISYKVLIVDDDPFVRTMYRKGLEKRGHSVEEVTDGHEAIDALSVHSYDVLILDIMMPTLNGTHLLRLLQDAQINARVLMVSSLHKSGIIESALLAGADYYLIKGDTSVHQVVQTAEMLCGLDPSQDIDED